MTLTTDPRTGLIDMSVRCGIVISRMAYKDTVAFPLGDSGGTISCAVCVPEQVIGSNKNDVGRKLGSAYVRTASQVALNGFSTLKDVSSYKKTPYMGTPNSNDNCSPAVRPIGGPARHTLGKGLASAYKTSAKTINKVLVIMFTD